MKKITLMFYTLFMLIACNVDDYEQEIITETQSANESDTFLKGKAARIDLAFIVQELTNSYDIHFNNNNATLSQKIVLLDSASMYVPLFTSLKPVGFALPTATEAAFFITSYEDSYENLNVSLQMMSYLDILTSMQSVDFTILQNTIQADGVLTPNEKMQLEFIVTYFHETYGGPIEDDSWSKKRIVAAVKGFEKSKANAVFNMALVKISN